MLLPAVKWAAIAFDRPNSVVEYVLHVVSYQIFITPHRRVFVLISLKWQRALEHRRYAI